MNDERDPRLEALFTEVEQELTDSRFTEQVMVRVQRRGRNVMLGRLAFVLVIVAFELALSSPLQTSIGALTEMLGTTLIQLDNEWLEFATAPLNSVAGLIGAILIGLQFLFRRTVR